MPRQTKARNRHSVRRGLTLVELLVVVLIVIMVSAALVPMVGKAMQNREIRESSRLLNTYLAAAQAQAIAEGRTVGVWFERAGNNPETCFQIYRAEVPPPYSGDIPGAVASIVPNGGTPWTATASLSASGSLTRLVNVGDTIRFGHKGFAYPITAVSAGQVTFTRPPTATVAVPPPSGAEGVTYQIYRMPRKSSLRSLELPVPAVVDITQSGLGIDPAGPLYVLPDAADYAGAPIVITFAPNGNVQYIYYGDGQPVRPTAPIHLLVGKSDQTGPANTADADALWVSIGQANGVVTTAPNAVRTAADGTQVPIILPDARDFAQEAQSVGGK